jgi:hypothetical protein
MTQQDPTPGNFTFEEDKERLRQLKANIEGAKAAVRDVKRAVDEEIAPYREKLRQFEEEEQVVRERLTIQAYGNYLSSNNKTFGGVTLRETPEVIVHDEQAVIDALMDEYLEDKPLVVISYSLDKKSLLEWAKARRKLGLALPEGMELADKFSIMVASDK